MDKVVDLVHQFIAFLRDPGPVILTGGYPIMGLIVFLETGALVFFLPGDSLLVTAGVYASSGQMNILWLNLILIPLAILGDATSYFIGRRSGQALFNKPESRFFKPQHMQAAQAFYDRHGGKAIIIARFMPIVRTFVPVVAGVGQMPYKRFASFNVIGGAAWVFSMTMLGYVLGNATGVLGFDIKKNIEKLIIIIVFLSILPGIIGWWRSRGNKPASPAPGSQAEKA
ncbi:MAG: VTT domain-containing protein [Myxococcaceae bacterium]